MRAEIFAKSGTSVWVLVYSELNDMFTLLHLLYLSKKSVMDDFFFFVSVLFFNLCSHAWSLRTLE